MPKQSMLHIAAVVGGGAFLKAFIMYAWQGHKAKVAARGIPMRRNRSGVYVAGGHIPAIESVMNVVGWIAAALFLLGIAAGIASAFD